MSTAHNRRTALKTAALAGALGAATLAAGVSPSWANNPSTVEKEVQQYLITRKVNLGSRVGDLQPIYSTGSYAPQYGITTIAGYRANFTNGYVFYPISPNNYFGRGPLRIGHLRKGTGLYHQVERYNASADRVGLLVPQGGEYEVRPGAGNRVWAQDLWRIVYDPNRNYQHFPVAQYFERTNNGLLVDDAARISMIEAEKKPYLGYEAKTFFVTRDPWVQRDELISLPIAASTLTDGRNDRQYRILSTTHTVGRSQVTRYGYVRVGGLISKALTQEIKQRGAVQPQLSATNSREQGYEHSSNTSFGLDWSDGSFTGWFSTGSAVYTVHHRALFEMVRQRWDFPIQSFNGERLFTRHGTYVVDPASGEISFISL